MPLDQESLAPAWRSVVRVAAAVTASAVHGPSPAATGPVLVALDIDGTVAGPGNTISDATLDAIARVRAAGHHVVLASGRSLVGILPVAARLGLTDGWVVASNGAVTARLGDHLPGGYALQDVRTFDAGPAMRLARALLPHVKLAVEEIGWGYRVLSLFPPSDVNGRQQVVGLSDLWTAPVSRAIVRAPGAVHALLEPLRRIGVTATPAASDWIDVIPDRLSKAVSLERIRVRLGVARENTVAVGDGVNDLEMMAWALRSVAMGHSPQAVLQAADEVTGSLADDGLVPVLRSLLPG